VGEERTARRSQTEIQITDITQLILKHILCFHVKIELLTNSDEEKNIREQILNEIEITVAMLGDIKIKFRHH
jgi:predicted amino acid-binding ACT domain protein